MLSITTLPSSTQHDPTIVTGSPVQRALVEQWLWITFLLLCFLDTAWLAVTSLTLSSNSWWMLIRLLPFAMLCMWGSVRLNRWPRFKLLCEGSLFMTVAWPALRLLNHLTMTTGLPLADIQLAAADNMMGFDWITYLGLLDRAPTLLGIMDFLYTSLSISIFFLSALTFSLVGSFFPALSAATHYAPLPEFNHFDPHIGAYHLDHLVALRTDIDHRLNLANMPGLVTFPSFHTAIGIIAIYCCRSMPLLLALSLLLNSLMIASTPLFGAHYLIDIIGGTFIAIAIIALYRIGSRLPVHIPPIDDRAPATNSY